MHKQSPTMVKLTTKELTTSQTSGYHKLTQREDKTTQKNYLSNQQSDKNNILKFQPKRRTFADYTFVTGIKFFKFFLSVMLSVSLCVLWSLRLPIPFLMISRTVATHCNLGIYIPHTNTHTTCLHGLKPKTITHTQVTCVSLMGQAHHTHTPYFFFFFSFSIFFSFYLFCVWFPLEEGSTQHSPPHDSSGAIGCHSNNYAASLNHLVICIFN
jgi:hypothetical protein